MHETDDATVRPHAFLALVGGTRSGSLGGWQPVLALASCALQFELHRTGRLPLNV